MRRNILTAALVLGLTLSAAGCTEYQATDGTHYGDPEGCKEICPILIVGAMVAVGAAIHH